MHPDDQLVYVDFLEHGRESQAGNVGCRCAGVVRWKSSTGRSALSPIYNLNEAKRQQVLATLSEPASQPRAARIVDRLRRRKSSDILMHGELGARLTGMKKDLAVLFGLAGGRRYAP